LPVPAFAAVVATANTFVISFFISVMSCWQKIIHHVCGQHIAWGYLG
jgi:hypothetical protein